MVNSVHICQPRGIVDLIQKNILGIRVNSGMLILVNLEIFYQFSRTLKFTIPNQVTVIHHLITHICL